MASKIIIMRHNAKKAGLHYDIRIKSEGNKWFSWRLLYNAKKDLIVPKSRNPISAIKTTVHSDSEAKFTGTIPDGEYGAGTISKVCECSIDIIKTDGFRTHVVFSFNNGKYIHQKWVLFNISSKSKKNKKRVWILFKANNKGEYHGKKETD